MKNILLFIVWFGALGLCGQALKIIPISDVKTTIIYFPEDVKDVDVGFPDDFDKTYDGKIVKITALGAFDYITNLSVTTLAGIYGFDITYKEDPELKYYAINPEDKAITFSEPLKELSNTENEEKNKPDIINTILSINQDEYIEYRQQQLVYFVLNAAYVKGEKIYFHLSIDNRSAIDYDIDYISVKNKSTRKNTKRMAKEQYDIPFVSHALFQKVKVKEKKSFVVEIEKLTLQEKTKIEIGIHELDGGRNGIFSYTQKDFKKIKLLEDKMTL